MRRTDRELAQNHDIQPAKRPYVATTPSTKPKRQLRKPRSKTIPVLITIIALLSGAWLGLRYYQQRQFLSHVPIALRQDYSFPVYYPSELPKGYSFGQGSDSLEGKVLFYSLRSSSGHIIISEQKAPKQLPDVIFPSASHIDTPNGEATVGKSTLGTLIVLNTKNTLINVSGSKTIPIDTLTDMVRNMRTIP